MLRQRFAAQYAVDVLQQCSLSERFSLTSPVCHVVQCIACAVLLTPGCTSLKSREDLKTETLPREVQLQCSKCLATVISVKAQCWAIKTLCELGGPFVSAFTSNNWAHTSQQQRGFPTEHIPVATPLSLSSCASMLCSMLFACLQSWASLTSSLLLCTPPCACTIAGRHGRSTTPHPPHLDSSPPPSP